jgi:hypothetical protein
MNALDIAIVVVALLVAATFVWSVRSARDAPEEPRRPGGPNRRREERDLL